MILRAKDIMTSNLVILRPDYSASLAKEIFMTNKITGAPVLDEQDLLVGVLSLFDLAHCPEQDLGKSLADIMTREPITAEAETSVQLIAQLMAEKHIHRLIIVEPESKRPIGIVSSLDVLKFFAWNLDEKDKIKMAKKVA